SRAQVGAEELGAAPAAGFDLAVALAEALQERQDEPDRAFCYAAPVGLRRTVADQNAELGRGVEIDVVDADRVLRADPALGRYGEEFAIDAARQERRSEQHLGAAGEREQRRARRAGRGDLHVAAGALELTVRFAALVDRPVDQDLRPRHVE